MQYSLQRINQSTIKEGITSFELQEHFSLDYTIPAYLNLHKTILPVTVIAVKSSIMIFLHIHFNYNTQFYFAGKRTQWLVPPSDLKWSYFLKELIHFHS